MLAAVTLYQSFVYGVVYLLFEAYPFVFERNHGFNAGENGLCFLGFFGGGFLTVIVCVLIASPHFAHSFGGPPRARHTYRFR